MKYQRLPFEQYFINTSQNCNKTGFPTYNVVYNAHTYQGDRLARIIKIEHEVNYELHYEEERDVIQFNFQCSIGFSDWFVNVFESATNYYDAIDFEGKKLQLKVHHGWGNMYKSIKHELRDSWSALHEEHPTAETEIIGWSLGAGQAILCAQDLNYNYGLKPHLITFGSIKPFSADKKDLERMKKYLDTLCAECWNFAEVNDIVTYMPPFKEALMIRRVDIGTDDRSFLKISNPMFYHMRYDRRQLYSKWEQPEEKQE